MSRTPSSTGQGRKPAIPATEAALSSVPRVPSWLNDTAKSVWKRTARHLVERRVLCATDLDILASFCVAAANVEIISSGRGDKYVNGSLSQAQLALRQAANELGLTPAARARLETEGGADGELSELDI